MTPEVSICEYFLAIFQMIPENSLSSRMRVRIGIKMRTEMKDEKKKTSHPKHVQHAFFHLSLSVLINYRTGKKKNFKLARIYGRHWLRKSN